MAAKLLKLSNRSMLGRRVIQLFEPHNGDMKIPLGVEPGTMVYNQHGEHVTTVPLVFGTEEAEQWVAIYQA